MESTSELPVWFVPLFVVGFPVFFIGLWTSICALISVVSGYRSLTHLRIDAAQVEEGEQLPNPWYAMIGWASYRGRILTLRASRQGLTLRILWIFPFHPPIRVPWERIREDTATGGRIAQRAPCVLLLDERVRFRVPAATFEAIREAKARYAR